MYKYYINDILGVVEKPQQFPEFALKQNTLSQFPVYVYIFIHLYLYNKKKGRMNTKKNKNKNVILIYTFLLL